MIQIEYQHHSDMDDYAIWLGAWTAASGMPPSGIFKASASKRAAELRFLYELAYDMELESNTISGTANYELDATVYDYDDLRGQGSVRAEQNGVQIHMYFNYATVENDLELFPGDKVKVTYHWNEDYIRTVKKVVKQ